MARKPEEAAPANVIKWTDEEWSMIALRLLETKGRALQTSPDLEEIKARDIFLAQESLPATRQRTLLSISPGIKASRQRIMQILQEKQPEPASSGSKEAATRGERTDAVPAKSSQEEVIPAQATPGDTRTAAVPAATPAATPAAAVSYSQRETAPSAATGEAGQQDHPVNAPVQAARPVAASHHGSAQHAAPARPTPNPGSEFIAPAGRKGGQNGDSSPRHQPGPRSVAPVSDAASHNAAGLVELARPFVAMVCEELASALVKAMTQKDNSQLLAALVQGASAGSRQPAARPVREDRAANREQAPHRQPVTTEFQAKPDEVPAAVHHDEDDPHAAETDVQPLFDPKLPPSANSAFKPMIALIGTSPQDFEDLQRQCPQFELKVVKLEDIRTEPSLRNCQRVVGLREGIPAPADEFLRRTFHHRYLRVTGGIRQLREQLFAWLDNPATMSAGPGRPQKHPSNKGPAPGHSKKRQFRRPKPNQ